LSKDQEVNLKPTSSWSWYLAVTGK